MCLVRCPSEGKAAALIMPICNTAAMNHHLSEISSQVAANAHAVVILDGAGWHRSQGLVVPGNITLLELPPYSPELNPVERIWHYLRSHWLANSLFASLANIANFGVSDRRFRFKPAGGFGGNRQAVSVQSGTPLRMGFGPDFGEPPLRDTSYLALVCQSKYSCHYYRF